MIYLFQNVLQRKNLASSPNCISQIGLTKLGDKKVWKSPRPRFFGITSKRKPDTPFVDETEGAYRSISTMSWRVISMLGSGGIPFQALLISPPRNPENSKIPLVVTPHGGA